MKSKIRLIFNNVAEIVGNERLGLLALTDEAQTMELLIPCDREMKEQLGLRLNQLPITKMLLPEVLWQLVRSHTDVDFEIIIDDIIDGQYRVLLYNTLTLEPIKPRYSFQQECYGCVAPDKHTGQQNDRRCPCQSH